MYAKRTILTALLAASPLSVRAACTPRRNMSETNNQELKILVPFAVPIGLPVAAFAPYYYSAAQFQPARTKNLAPRATDNGPVTTDKARTDSDLVAAHCASCHSGPAPKAGLSFDHLDSVSLTDRLRAIRAVASSQMPKGSKLADNEIRALIEQLTATTP